MVESPVGGLGLGTTVLLKFGRFPSLSTVDVLAGDGLQRGPLAALQAFRLRPFSLRHVTLGTVELDLGADVPRPGVVHSLGDSGTGTPARFTLAHHGRRDLARDVVPLPVELRVEDGAVLLLVVVVGLAPAPLYVSHALPRHPRPPLLPEVGLALRPHPRHEGRPAGSPGASGRRGGVQPGRQVGLCVGVEVCEEVVVGVVLGAPGGRVVVPGHLFRHEVVAGVAEGGDL